MWWVTLNCGQKPKNRSPFRKRPAEHSWVSIGQTDQRRANSVKVSRTGQNVVGTKAAAVLLVLQAEKL